MARQKSKSSMTTEELIELNQTEIEETQAKLNLLKEEKLELLARKEKEELNNLVKTLELAGISFTEAAELIKSKVKEQPKETDKAISKVSKIIEETA